MVEGMEQHGSEDSLECSRIPQERHSLVDFKDFIEFNNEIHLAVRLWKLRFK